MTGWTKAWLAWGIASVLGFAGIEAKALRSTEPNATLSAYLRTTFGFDERGPMPHVRRGIFYGLWGWFGLHILKRTAGCVSCITTPKTPS